MKDVISLIIGGVLVITIGAFGLSKLNEASSQIAEENCQEISVLYEADYRYSDSTGCELYISEPQWIKVN